MAYKLPKNKPASDIVGATTPPSVGFIGQVITSGLTAPVALTTGTITSITSITLDAGNYIINACGGSVNTTGNLFSSVEIALGTTNNSFTGVTIGDNKVQVNGPVDVFAGTISINVNISTTTTYYLTFRSIFTTGSATGRGRITATRVG